LCRSAQLIFELCRSAQLIFELCRSARLLSTYIWDPSFIRFAPCPSAQLHVCKTPPERFAFGARICELCRSAQFILELCRSARLRLTCVWDHSFLCFAPCLSAQLHICTTTPERFAFGAQIFELCIFAQLIFELCRSAQLIFEVCRSARLRSTYIWGPSFLRFALCPSAQPHVCKTPPERLAFGAQIFELRRSVQLILELCRSARLRSTYIWGPSFLCFAPCLSAQLHICTTPPERFAFGARVCELCRSAQLIFELCRSAQLIFELCRSARLRSTYIWGPSFLRFAWCPSAQLHGCLPLKGGPFGAQICELCRSAQLIFELCRSARLRLTYIWDHSFLCFAPCLSAQLHICTNSP